MIPKLYHQFDISASAAELHNQILFALPGIETKAYPNSPAPYYSLPKSNMTAINEQDIERFLKFLDSDTEVFNYSLFHDPSGEIVKPGIRFGTRSEILQALQHEPNATLHVTLNRTKLSGRKKSDIESCRVLCVDLDREVTDEEIRQIVEKFYPHLVVRSSPNKYHIYWKVYADLGLDEWSNVQAGLAWFFKADDNLAQPTHLMRVPGVERLTKTGEQFMPEIVWHEERPEETAASLLTVFPGLEEMKDEARKQKETKKAARKKKLDAHRQGKTKALEELAAEENRNQTLYDFIRDFVYRSELEPEESEVLERATEFNAALAQHNAKGALPQSEVEATARSGAEAGRNGREIREARRAEQSNKKPESIQEFEYDFAAGPLQENKYSEQALIERLKQRFEGRLIRVDGVVHVFSDGVWVPQNSKTHGHTLELLDSCKKEMVKEAEFIEKFGTTKDGFSISKYEKEVAHWYSGARLNSLWGIVSQHKGFTTHTESPFDRNPNLFLCKNGVLDLLTGELREPRAEDYLLKSSGLEYKPGEKSEWWEEFLNEVFQDNLDAGAVIRFLQEVFGYALTGRMDEQMVFIHYGAGANGKSRVLGALRAITGGYAARLQPDSLGVKKNGAAKLLERVAIKTEGRRVVIIDDLDSGMEWNEGLIKSLTETTVIARNLYEEERDIQNTAKMHLSCNQIPKVENSSHAIYRRMAILEYGRQFEINPNKFSEINDKINASKSGILNWAIAGLQRIDRRPNKRIEYPEEVLGRVQEYEAANSTLERKLSKCIAPLQVSPLGNADCWISIEELWNHVENHGLFPVGKLEEIGREGLGALLSRIGVRQRRIRIDGKRERQYAVRLISRAEQSFN